MRKSSLQEMDDQYAEYEEKSRVANSDRKIGKFHNPARTH